MENRSPTAKASSLRWGILRQAFIARPSLQSDHQSQIGISRKTSRGFNLISCSLTDGHIEDDSDSLSKIFNSDGTRDARVCYTLPMDGASKLFLIQRVESRVDLSDFEISNRYNVDNTGIVCQWPSEDVLAYFSLSHPDLFRSKRILELGSGYGLAGLVIAASTDALEVVISDGNPQVVDLVMPWLRLAALELEQWEEKTHFHTLWGALYETPLLDIQRNINANSGAFGNTKVKSMTLHWNQEEITNISNTFDVIVASDCTFFKEFHKGLVRTVKSLLKPSQASEAIFFSPKRGNSLDKFLEEIKEIGLHFSITEKYNAEVWIRHQRFLNGDDSWPNYEKDHCYPLLLRITL
ncbi:hypothetical protein HHK36_008682 [Tetracentron sinense]|uniref:Calmodulin-lysine N-methyltransferase n=1 Tax=Tetracentron sinense TaxID=13715 RepID=A0A835DNK5_TETSI|nr:hypothetical protein HHK36_008682 [Tetracentron sinense]